MSNKIGGDVLVFRQTALLGELHFLLIRQSRFWANNNIPLLLLLNGLHANILEGFYMAARYLPLLFSQGQGNLRRCHFALVTNVQLSGSSACLEDDDLVHIYAWF